jgi:hypothetical protein
MAEEKKESPKEEAVKRPEPPPNRHTHNDAREVDIKGSEGDKND